MSMSTRKRPARELKDLGPELEYRPTHRGPTVTAKKSSGPKAPRKRLAASATSNGADDDNVRSYGSDDYWIRRYAEHEKLIAAPRNMTSAHADQTDEWLLSWAQVAPLLSGFVARDAALVDLGCGTSTLALDMLRDHLTAGTIAAVDIAPGAIEAQRHYQQKRIAKGDSSARRLHLRCADVCSDNAWQHNNHNTVGPFDGCLDKSTTDGLLCDTRHGAARVKRMYAAVGAVLQPTATVVVVSWRDPQDGLEWFCSTVFGGLVKAVPPQHEEAASSSATGQSYVWTLDVHSLVSTDGAGEQQSGPHVFLLRRRPRRSSRRLAAALDDDGTNPTDLEVPELPVRLHIHD